MRRHGWTGVLVGAITSLGLMFVAGCGGQADRAAPPSSSGIPSASSSSEDSSQSATQSGSVPDEPATAVAPAAPSAMDNSGEPDSSSSLPLPAAPATPRSAAAMPTNESFDADMSEQGAASRPLAPMTIERSLASSPAATAQVPSGEPRAVRSFAPKTIEPSPLPAAAGQTRSPMLTTAPSAAQPKAHAAAAESPPPQFLRDMDLAEMLRGDSSPVERSLGDAPPPATAPPPSMAESAAESSNPDSMAESFIPESATGESSSASSAAPPAAPAAPQSALVDSGEYTTVNLFYGTDRLPVGNNGPSAGAYLAWLAGTAACAGVAVLTTILAIRLRRRRAWMAVFGAGAAGTAVLTIVAAGGIPRAPANPSLARVYGNERGTMEVGTCQVSIPKCHEVGELESPSILRLEFKEDPRRHIVVLDVSPEREDAFFQKLHDRVEVSSKEILVFVHGFNMSFEAAASRTAQIAYDLKFKGVPVFYSWPSQGGLLQYTVDETNVVWTVPHLKDFLTNIARRSGADSIHLIAHSMGNRALTAALQTLNYEVKDEVPMFRQVVLAAPDIDADVFRRDIAPAVVRMANRVTLYASSKDEALVLSKQIHGYPRAGDSGSGTLVLPGIDTVDASSVDTSWLGHSYYGSNQSVLDDLWALLHESRPPDQRRWLRPVDRAKRYWEFLSDQARLQELGLGRAPR